MGRPYQITINNGTGSGQVLNGSYDIDAAVTGYLNGSILPATQAVIEGTNSYAFTIEADGTLTLHISEDGTAEGTAIVGATFSRCDSAGNVYGAEVVSDASGNAVFPYIPYAATNAPLVYYKQTASDGNHEFSPALVNTSLTTSAKTLQITNAPAATRTFVLTDAKYGNLPISSGTLTLS